MAADVYTRDPVKGRAGWTWYTGASGWMYQAGIEWILGLRREGERLYVRPSIPGDWPSYQVRYRYGGSVYRIAVHTARSGAAEETADHGVTVDGLSVEPGNSGDAYIPLVDDGREHEVIVGIPQVGSGIDSIKA
jgi:cellobiose phosphorylase